MAQRKQLTFSELRVAVFVLVAMVILVVGIFYVTGASSLAPKYRVRTYLPEVEGLVVGAPVTLAGVQVGNVESIKLNSEAPDAMHTIEVGMRIEKKYRNWIRANSSAKLVTQGLLGNRYVSISRGAPPAPVVAENGVVPGSEEASTKAIVERGAELMQNLNVLTGDVRDVIAQMKSGQGTIGKFLNDPSLYNHLNDTATRADRLVAAVEQGQGTAGKLVVSDELYRKADSAVGRVDDVLAAVQTQKGTLGKLVYDPSIYNRSNRLFERGNSLLAGVEQGRGTMGKLVKDPALYNNLRDASANVRDVTARLNQGQGTMGKFFTDPRLYDNVTGLSGDLRLLIGDFRRNPKKYLRIKFSLF
jgi:phospholipid/cholesterol/gamma-HCH transport system substrate-binding protein